jgi:HD superfamily phosphohydrolase
VADGAAVASPQPPRVFEDVRAENMDRLLWIFLKLLHSRTALDRFFAHTSEQDIRARKEEAERKLRMLQSAPSQSLEHARQRASLEDIVATSDLRLQNLRKARENHEFLQLEIERLDAKIAGIAEMGINRQDLGAVTGEIDVVSTSAVETERAMHEIDTITGLDFTDDRVPPQLIARTATTVQR